MLKLKTQVYHVIQNGLYLTGGKSRLTFALTIRRNILISTSQPLISVSRCSSNYQTQVHVPNPKFSQLLVDSGIHLCKKGLVKSGSGLGHGPAGRSRRKRVGPVALPWALEADRGGEGL